MELPYLKITDESLRKQVVEILSPLYINEEGCKKLVAVFEDEIEKGTLELNQFWIYKWSLLGLQHGLSGSSLQMENTFIPELLGSI